jgi:hypothetical protein
MATTWRYRLFKTGRMPEALKTAAGGVDVVVAVEGISLAVHGRSVRLPGIRYGRSVKLAVGAVVVTSRRLLVSFGRWLIVDTALGSGEDPHRVTFADDGVRLFPDVPTLFPEGSGELEFHWRTELAPTQLASLPSGPSSVPLPSEIAPLILRCVR